MTYLIALPAITIFWPATVPIGEDSSGYEKHFRGPFIRKMFGNTDKHIPGYKIFALPKVLLRIPRERR
jgi:hypothetical protein